MSSDRVGREELVSDSLGSRDDFGFYSEWMGTHWRI